MAKTRPVAKSSDDLRQKRQRLLNEFGSRVDWFKNDKFLKELEGDSVDTEILDEELRSLQDEDHQSCRGRLVRFLDSNPLQIVLCVLVLVDAGVVVTEILLDLHAIRGEYTEAESQLNRCLSFIKTHYGQDLNGYDGGNVDIVLKILGEKFPFNETQVLEESHDKHKRYVTMPPGQPWYPVYGEGTPNHLPRDAQDTTDQASRNIEVSPHKDTFLDHVLSSRNRPAVVSSAAMEPVVERVAAGSLYPEDHHNRQLQEPDDAVVKERHKRGGGSAEEETYVIYLNGTNGTTYKHTVSKNMQYSKFLIKIAHILHYISVAILGVFVVQVFLKIIGMGGEFFRKKMEIFDGVIIIISFVLDVVFMDGVGSNDNSDEASALVILFLLWRLLRVINGIMVTAKQRQEFRIKLQKRARRRAEKRIELMEEDQRFKEKEVCNLQSLSQGKGATDLEITMCKPRRRSTMAKNTSVGLSSIASLSLGFTMSMSGGANSDVRRQSMGMFGPPGGFGNPPTPGKKRDSLVPPPTSSLLKKSSMERLDEETEDTARDVTKSASHTKLPDVSTSDKPECKVQINGDTVHEEHSQDTKDTPKDVSPQGSAPQPHVPPRAAILAVDATNGPVAIATTQPNMDPGDSHSHHNIHWFQNGSKGRGSLGSVSNSVDDLTRSSSSPTLSRDDQKRSPRLDRQSAIRPTSTGADNSW